MIDSTGVADLELVGGSGPDDPWLRFGLALNYCCSEPNSVVFGSDQWAIDVDGGLLRIDGPTCDERIECTDTERRVRLTPFESTVVMFDVYRDVVEPGRLSAGTFTAEVTPMFEWDGGALDPEPLPITVRFDISAPVAPPSGDTTPTLTAHLPVTVVGGGLELIAFPFAGVADTADELAAFVSGSVHEIRVDELAVDWETQAVVVIAIGENLCPALLNAIEVTNGVARPVFVNAGYLMCEDPLVAYTVIAAVDRDQFAGVSQFVVSADLAIAEQDTVVPVSVTPSTGDYTVEPTSVAFGQRSGVVPLPRRGEAGTGALDDGTPVFVVHHHDGTVSALDPRSADHTVDGLYRVVRWVAATRTFLGAGAWDEYGRRVDGFRTSDLHGYATQVVDGHVEIGSQVPAPAGSPITSNTAPPAMADLDIERGPILSFDDAMVLPVGATAWIDALVYALPDGANVCAAVGSTEPGTAPMMTAPASPGCPEGSPTADGIIGTPGYVNYYLGPLLATRNPDGFERIASSGGYGGTML